MKHTTLALALACLSFAVGCGPSYEEHRISHLRAGAGGTVSPSSLEVTLPEGAIVTVSMVPYDSDDEPMSEAEVYSDDRQVLEVVRVAGHAASHFAFVGRRAGETTVRYFAEGREVRRARARVTAAN